MAQLNRALFSRMNWFQIRSFFQFYRVAVTKYQLHSPYVFELVMALLEDRRGYYAFRDIEEVRQKMHASTAILLVMDYGTGGNGKSQKRQVRQMARQSSSSTQQGRLLFRLAQFLQPKTMLEIGGAVGIGTLYLASAVRGAKIWSLEGCEQTQQLARLNAEVLGLAAGIQWRVGPFEQTLEPTLREMDALDLVFMDGNHRLAPTWLYFEQCLAYAHEQTVFVLDDVHGSSEMTQVWEKIKQHERVRLTLDFFDVSLVLLDPNFKEKQHLSIVPARWKPWRFW